MEDKNKDLNKEGTQEEPKKEVTEMKQKTGFGTALKIGAGLAVGAVFTGLGWFLKGIFSGKDSDDEPVKTETTEE